MPKDRNSVFDIPPPVPLGTGKKYDEPSKGQDTYYDGAYQMSTTSFLYGPKDSRYSTKQCYSASFGSKVPRWDNRGVKLYGTAIPNQYPVLGPGQYALPEQAGHRMSASLSWKSRGRSGPVGVPFFGAGSVDDRTSSFAASTGRFGIPGRERRRGPTTQEDMFVCKSDGRKEQLARADFANHLQSKIIYFGATPLSRPSTGAL